VRAVLGQQITVAAARTLAQRLVDRLASPSTTPPELTACSRARRAGAGQAMRWGSWASSSSARRPSRAGAGGGPANWLHAGADVPATITALKALPGIGDWTAQYIAMRALRWPDAFPAGDVALHKALGVQGHKHPARAAEEQSPPGGPGAAMPCCAPGALPAAPARNTPPTRKPVRTRSAHPFH
jgi:AraC family transcriptional regulator of adaptative response / DNA-3-methyladenine glycosylase II